MVIDGEHYPPVIEAALADLEDDGHELVGLVMAGGTEKIPAGGLDLVGSLPVHSASDTRQALDEAISEKGPDAVIDLSDEPVLDYRRRHELAAVALYRGLPYEGPGFYFHPPERSTASARPSLAVIATGKRTGKTAVASFTARALVDAGSRPVIVAMGRGGPPEPELLRGDELELSPTELLAMADRGRHAASDYIEDAMLAGVPTVGCRRCGGGLTGQVQVSNVPAGIEKADSVPGDLTILEGSGAAVPPARAEATILVIPASIPFEYVLGYMGPYRLLLADCVVVTMCENPFGSPSRVSELVSHIRKAWRPLRGDGGDRGDVRVVRTVFRPHPVRPVEGKTTFVATTAPKEAGAAIVSHLEDEHGCEVVGISHSLSNRRVLQAELDEAKEAEVLLCEIKAAGIDVATRWGLDKGLEVTYMNNVPQGIEGDDVRLAVVEVADLARSRFAEQNS